MSDDHINIFASEEDAGYIADIPDLAHCSAFGATPEEALSQVLIARAAWLEAARAEGKPIPAATYRPAIYQLSELPGGGRPGSARHAPGASGSSPNPCCKA